MISCTLERSTSWLGAGHINTLAGFLHSNIEAQGKHLNGQGRGTPYALARNQFSRVPGTKNTVRYSKITFKIWKNFQTLR